MVVTPSQGAGLSLKHRSRLCNSLEDHRIEPIDGFCQSSAWHRLVKSGSSWHLVSAGRSGLNPACPAWRERSRFRRERDPRSFPLACPLRRLGDRASTSDAPLALPTPSNSPTRAATSFFALRASATCGSLTTDQLLAHEGALSSATTRPKPSLDNGPARRVWMR